MIVRLTKIYQLPLAVGTACDPVGFEVTWCASLIVRANMLFRRVGGHGDVGAFGAVDNNGGYLSPSSASGGRSKRNSTFINSIRSSADSVQCHSLPWI